VTLSSSTNLAAPAVSDDTRCSFDSHAFIIITSFHFYPEIYYH